MFGITNSLLYLTFYLNLRMMNDEQVQKVYHLLGERIRLQRMQRKIKQEVLADQLNMSRTSIVNIEKGRQRPSIHLLLELSSIFRIEVVDLIPPYPEITPSDSIGAEWKERVKQETEGDSSSKEKLTKFLKEVTSTK